MLEKLGSTRQSKKIKTAEEEEREKKDAQKELEDAEEKRKETARRERTLLQEAQEVKRQRELEGRWPALGTI